MLLGVGVLLSVAAQDAAATAGGRLIGISVSYARETIEGDRSRKANSLPLNNLPALQCADGIKFFSKPHSQYRQRYRRIVSSGGAMSSARLAVIVGGYPMVFLVAIESAT
jgi:hypothetical protein